MKKRSREVIGVVMLACGVAALFVGIHAVSGGQSHGGPAIGAGIVANVIAYRVLRTTTRPTDDHSDSATAPR